MPIWTVTTRVSWPKHGRRRFARHLASCCACAARNAELLAVQDDLVQQLRELNQANPTSAPAAARLPCGGATMTAYPLMHAETVGEQVGPYKTAREAR